MKKIFSLLLAIMLFFSMSLTVFAEEKKDYKLDITVQSDKTFDSTVVSTAGGGVVDIIATIAMIIGVVMVIVAGMKYMLAPAGGKADVKSTMMPLLIGGILVGASGWLIPSIINWSTQMQ